MSAVAIAKCWTFVSSRGDRSYQTLLCADGSTSCDCPGFGGCGPTPQASHEARKEAEERQKAEKKIIEERTGREQAEARLRAQEERTSRWQVATVLAVSAAGLALIVGCILGSRARHEADQ